MRARLSTPLLLPVGFLGAVAAGAWLLHQQPLGWFPWVLGTLIVVPVLWVLISALFPARAERACPRCAREALERSDPRTTHGLRCRECGWQDDSASAWLLAEEEEPALERLVLADREGERATVDSSHRVG